MDFDVSHFELTAHATNGDAENRLNASPAKEEYKKEVCPHEARALLLARSPH